MRDPRNIEDGIYGVNKAWRDRNALILNGGMRDSFEIHSLLIICLTILSHGCRNRDETPM